MRASSKWSLGVAVAIVAMAPVGVEGQQPPPLPEGVTQQMVDQGRDIFAGAGLCANCHGQAGVGTTFAPALTDNEWLHVDGTFDSIVKVITDGVLQPKQSSLPMAPRGASNINDTQVRAVAAYVWRLANGS